MPETDASKSEISLKDLTAKRSSIKGRVTKFKNYLDSLSKLDGLPPLELVKLKSKLSKFEALFTEFDLVQEQIEVINVSTQDVELSARELIEQDFFNHLAQAQQLVDANSDDYKSTSSRRSSVHCPGHDDSEVLGFKLPVIKIPTFDGTYFKWLEFRDTFVSLVHERKIRDVHKFYYLNSYLDGEASRVISNLEVTDKNYSEAWKLLCDRYDNKRQLINNHLKSLFSLESVRETEKSLRFIIDHVTKNLRALHTLGLPTDKWDILIIYIVAQKLDSRTCFKWEEHRNSLNEIPSLDDFFNFLRNRADVIETVDRHSQPVRHASSSNSAGRHRPQTRVMLGTSSQGSSSQPSSSTLRSCHVCQGSHRVYECPVFKAKSIDDKMSTVESLKLCHVCLRQGHKPQRCKLSGGCKTCKERHNTLLHERFFKEGSSRSQPVITMCALSSSEALLCTAEVDLINPVTNVVVKARAVLDSGSQSCLITSRIRDFLQLTPTFSTNNLVGIAATPVANKIERCTVRVQSRCSSFSALLSCVVLPIISDQLPTRSFSKDHLNLSDVQLADPQFNKSSNVDLLLGAELFWELLGTEQRSLGDNNPVLRSSKLGWLVTTPMVSDVSSSDSLRCNLSRADDIVELNNNLSKFWELEKVPRKSVLSEEEALCEQHFLANTSRDADGRFIVKLPLRAERDCLGNSLQLAKKRFFNLESRFRRQPLLKELYFDFMREYADLGHLSDCGDVQRFLEVGYFLPHHPVLKNNSESTKLRVVFDASARSSSGLSVNDIQMTGPTIQDSLFNILTRFRLYKYVISGDVEKMFRQIMVHPDDRSLQLVLWRDNESQPLRTLMLNTVTYGFSSASFLSTRCLWQLGEEAIDPMIKDVIQRDFYVDDLLTGAQTENELRYIQQSVAEALAKGGFHLRKYRSNLPSVLEHSSTETSSNLMISNATSTLGIGWMPKSDELHFPIELPSVDVVTKRSILSSTFKVFDPLGLLSVCTIKPKMLLQELWAEHKLGWDDPVPDKIKSSWLTFVDGLNSIAGLRLPRYILVDRPVNIEMHCFCDASQKAYGACIYLKSTNEQGEIKVSLLCSKSRVAPVTPTTIPRLELCAALLGAELSTAVIQALRFRVDRCFYWSDSKVVLSWLHTTKGMKTFIANRVGTIKELTDPCSWRYVPTSQNPAYLVSRGIDPEEIIGALEWWHGPSFLQLDESSWPPSDIEEMPELPEIKAFSVLVGDAPLDLSRISRLSILQRAYARIFRWVHNSKIANKDNKLTGPLQASEIDKATKALIKISQKDSFNDEIRLLSLNKTLKAKSDISSLNPFLDSEGIIRVGGRIGASSYDFDKKHPVLLHANSHFTKLLFRQEHKRLLHAGPQLLLASIRDRYWPIGGRNLARSVARNCVVCHRFKGQHMTNIMGNLPSERLDPDIPFSNIGTDFAGPFLITDRKGRGCKITKCYLCIFICLNYKCIHLEAVSELSKDAFMLSLKRFIARRGLPKKIFCDNGTNFVAAAREINDFFMSKDITDSISGFAAQQGIEFHFSPAYAPHFQGYTEAGVKSAKHHLRRVMGEARLTFEELCSLFTQIEAFLNSRPLCPLSPSPTDLQPLTPGHFLIGRPLTALPAPALMEYNAHRLDRYQRLEQMRQHFWRRWSSEYVSELQQRTKWKTRCKDLQVDDLVLLKEDATPPLCWRLGRVDKIFPGSDGVPRVADVTTSRGMVRRALNRLCLLPTADECHG
ncbi:hypothetical protein ABMA28_010141 [Loxostege sticticalis]|uniref:Integrase catalytic domain-containing protein n=1 Tax=Loxostege sticticalis TaxID=481309 RepID=A0ABD0SAT8_LOXSC